MAEKRKNRRKEEQLEVLPLGKKNILVILIGILLIIIGNILTAQEDFIDATQFSLSLYVVPIILLAGVGVIVFGVVKKF